MKIRIPQVALPVLLLILSLFATATVEAKSSPRADRVLVFVTWTGTHDGELRGYPATAKRVQVRRADLYHIADGQIVEHWDVASPLDLLLQIGLLEFKSAAKP